MRTKIVHTLFSGLGGHGSVVFSLLAESLNDGFDHFVLFYGVEDLLEEYRQKCLLYNIPFVFVKKRRCVDLLSGLKVIKSLKTFNGDFILINSTNLVLPAYLYKIIFKKKFAVVEHTPNYMKGHLDWFRSLCSQFLADAVICLSETYKTELKKKFGRFLKSEKNQIIPNGLDVDYYKPLDKPCKSFQVVKIGIHSRLTPQKDYVTLFKSVEKLSHKTKQSFIVYIAGDGEDYEMLLNLANDLGIDKYVKFLGMLPETSILQFLLDLDIYVMSSFAETMCTSIMQAMSCGLPVIATDIDIKIQLPGLLLLMLE